MRNKEMYLMWTKIQFLLLAFHHCRGLPMPTLKKIEMAQGPVFIYLWVKLKPESREPSACYILSSKKNSNYCLCHIHSVPELYIRPPPIPPVHINTPLENTGHGDLSIQLSRLKVFGGMKILHTFLYLWHPNISKWALIFTLSINCKWTCIFFYNLSVNFNIWAEMVIQNFPTSSLIFKWEEIFLPL